MVSLFPHPASFRFHLAVDTLAFGYLLPTAGRIRVFHPLETCAAGRTGQRNKPSHSAELISLESGNVLLSRPVSRQVPSALKGLTSVFGMGTGGSLSPLSPEFCQGSVQSVVRLASGPSVFNRAFRLGNSPHISRLSFLLRVP